MLMIKEKCPVAQMQKREADRIAIIDDIMTGERELDELNLKDLVQDALADDGVVSYIIDAVKSNGLQHLSRLAISEVIEHCIVQINIKLAQIEVQQSIDDEL
jgi:RNA-binding protein YlmH